MQGGLHEPTLIHTDTALFSINEALQSSPVFLQAYTDDSDEECLVNVPFPMDTTVYEKYVSNRIICDLNEKLNLNTICGYISLIKLKLPTKISSESDLPDKNAPEIPFEKYLLYDCVFGIPLFDESLNKQVCENMTETKVLHPSNFANIKIFNDTIEQIFDAFLEKYGGKSFTGASQFSKSHMLFPVRGIIYDANKKICTISNQSYF